MRRAIDHTINFDGPGFSGEYLAAHKNDISNSEGLISHYAWSWVGVIMTQPEGVEDRLIYAHQDRECGSGDQDLFGIDIGIKKSLFWTHHPRNVHFGEDDSVMDITGDNINPEDGVEENLAFLGASSYITNAADNPLGTFAMSVFVPGFGLINSINQLSSIQRSGREHMERALNDLKDLIGNMVHTVYRQTHLPDVSGDFEINVQRAHAIGTDIEDMSKSTREIIGEIERIQGSLKFISMSGSYYKSQLWFMCNRLSRDADGLDKAAAAIHSCSVNYYRTDSEVGESYI